MNKEGRTTEADRVGPADSDAVTVDAGQLENSLPFYGFFLIAGGVISLLLSVVENPIGRGILIAIGVLTFVIQRLSLIQACWGGILLVTGILAFRLRRRGMFILIGVVLLSASLLNFFGGKIAGWTFFGIPQLILGLSMYLSYLAYAPKKEFAHIPFEEKAVPGKAVESPFNTPSLKPEFHHAGAHRPAQVDEVISKGKQPARLIRVFISSTFRDMSGERDELVKITFPQLRKLCEQRGVSWGEVDLRWGITDEQRSEGRVLPICLDEIQRCRPYFIGLLGERYGWIPDEIPPELIEREPWLAERHQHSVTELEILHGVLNNPGMAERALFYFRDPGFIETLPREKRPDYLECATPEEIREFGPAEGQRRAEERKQKLADLKQRIRSSGLPLHENYWDPREFGQLVLKDLTDLINDLYPEGLQVDALEREAAEHEAFAQSRAQVYIGRRSCLDQLDAHAHSEGEPLVILGELGLGKSALLANWAMEYRREHPDELLLMHFTGATPASTDWASMLRRILGEIQRKFNFQEEIPDQPEALRSAFVKGLNMASARGRVVLVLDALNQLEDRDGAPDLVWLPPHIPENIRMFLSTLPGRPLDDLRKRGWQSLSVEPLQSGERKQLIHEYLGLFTKALSPALTDRIAGAAQCENPLFLRVLLDELRLFGMHERLGEQVEGYLHASSIPRLYEMILKRCEQDYERERPSLVREAMSLLWAARRGLTEAELMELLGAEGLPLPHAQWSPLSLALEQSFLSRGGFIGFSHDYLRQAVRNRYLHDPSAQAAIYLRLADYFEAQSGASPRRLDELPWQLAQAGEWQRLSTLLGDLEFFGAAWEFNPYDVKAYWARVEDNSPCRITNTYRQVIDHPGQNHEHVWGISSFLSDMGHLEEALSLRTYLVEYYRKTGDIAGSGHSLVNQALIFKERGDLRKALVLQKQAERIFRMLGDENGLAASLSNQANILHARGDPGGAMKLHKKAEHIYRELGNKDKVGLALGNQAVILEHRGDLDGAMALHKEEERLYRESGDKDGLQRTLGNQANILYYRGDLDGAMALHKEVERVYRELGDKDGLGRSLGDQALILKDRGNLDAAMALSKEEERISRELGKKQDLQRNLNRQAVILYDRGDLDGAMALHREVERLCRELGIKDGLGISLGNQALILSARGNLDEAMALHKEEERIYRQLGDKVGLARSLSNQANILSKRGDLDGAMALNREVERLCRELGDKALLQASLGSQANILFHRGDLDGSMALHKEEEKICRELGYKNGLQNTLGNQGVILEHRGDPDGAMTLYKEQESLCRELGNKAGLQAALGNQGILLYHHGDLDRAMAQYKEQERICRELGDKDGLGLSLGNQALIQSDRGNLDEAMALHKEEERICHELGNKAGLGRSLGNQAIILSDRGDLNGAMALHKKEERLYRELGDKAGLHQSLNSQANILSDRGDKEKAMALYKEKERICRELGDKRGLALSLGNQALILVDRGDLDGAITLHKEEERLCRDVGDKDGLQHSLGNHALSLADRGDLNGAMALLKEQERICHELGNPESMAISLKNRAIILAKMGKKGEARRLAEESLKLAQEHGYRSLAEQIKKDRDRW